MFVLFLLFFKLERTRALKALTFFCFYFWDRHEFFCGFEVEKRKKNENKTIKTICWFNSISIIFTLWLKYSFRNNIVHWCCSIFSEKINCNMLVWTEISDEILLETMTHHWPWLKTSPSTHRLQCNCMFLSLRQLDVFHLKALSIQTNCTHFHSLFPFPHWIHCNILILWYSHFLQCQSVVTSCQTEQSSLNHDFHSNESFLRSDDLRVLLVE